MRKVKLSRIHRFPAGYDPALFSCPPFSKKRTIDVLFVGRYRRGMDGYYHKRKRYGFQIALAKRLVEQGRTVAFLGSDWDGCEYTLDSRVQILDLPHSRMPRFIRMLGLSAQLRPRKAVPFLSSRVWPAAA